MREDETPAGILARCKNALSNLKGTQYAGGDSIKIQVTRATKVISLPPYYYGTVPMTFTTEQQVNAFVEVVFVNATDVIFDCRKVLTPKDSKLNAFSIYCDNNSASTFNINLDVVILSTDKGVIS